MDDIIAQVSNKDYFDLTPWNIMWYTNGTTNCVPRDKFGRGTRMVPDSHSGVTATCWTGKGAPGVGVRPVYMLGVFVVSFGS